MKTIGKSRLLAAVLVAWVMMVTACAMPAQEKRGGDERAIKKTDLVRGTTQRMHPGSNGPSAAPPPIDPEWTGEETNPPPRDPSQPRVFGLRTLAVDMSEVQFLLGGLLYGTRIALDATNTGPYVTQGTKRVCRRESKEAYEEARRECLRLTNGRGECLVQADKDYPVVCRNYSAAYHSFLSFPDDLKRDYPSLTDYVYDLDPIVTETRWFGRFKVTINKILATLASSNLKIFGGRDHFHHAYIAMGARAESGSPTAYCENLDHFFCQDIQLSNMNIQIRLQGLKPAPADPARVAFSNVGVLFSFDRNINNVPDPLVEVFYDIDNRIRERVTQKVQAALADEPRRTAISKAITTILNSYGQFKHTGDWTGFKVIDEVTYDRGILYVHYKPN